MYKIEVNNDTTLEGLLESFKNLKECGIEGYVEIEGTEIFGSDDNLKDTLKEIFRSRKNIEGTETPPIKEENPIIKEIKYSLNLADLKLNEVFKYYLGISLKYTKQEYREKLKKYYVDVYCQDNTERIRDIHLLANILLLLEYKDIFLIQEKLNLLFLNISKDDIEKLHFVILRIKKYAINGHLIDQCFYQDILNEVVENKEQEAGTSLKRIPNS